MSYLELDSCLEKLQETGISRVTIENMTYENNEDSYPIDFILK